MTAKHKKAQGTCTLWFEYLTSSAGTPIDKEGAAELRERVLDLVETYGYAFGEAQWSALINGSKRGPCHVLKVGSSFVDGPELVSRALPILPNAVSVVTASGDGRPTGAESDAFAQIKRITRDVIPVYWAE